MFANGLVKHSRHTIELMTLPARFWKWRMRGAALHFIQHINKLDEYDVLMTSDLMSLADLRALSKGKCPPTLVYFHENQLTYPLAPGEIRDYQFGFTDITSALTAEAIRFNSHYHMSSFFSALKTFIRRMPEFRPNWVIDNLTRKADVIYPGVDLANRQEVDRARSARSADSPPLIIWNHRWEFDKNPQLFFEVLDTVLSRGVSFRLALLGENFQAVPKPFLKAKATLGHRILQYGYEPDRDVYKKWLQKGTVVISTAQQENFGLAVIEAISAGCIPLLPDRLAYPEVIHQKLHHNCLYTNKSDLIEKLITQLTSPDRFSGLRDELMQHVQQYDWNSVIGDYDDLLSLLANNHDHCTNKT